MRFFQLKPICFTQYHGRSSAENRNNMKTASVFAARKTFNFHFENNFSEIENIRSFASISESFTVSLTPLFLGARCEHSVRIIFNKIHKHDLQLSPPLIEHFNLSRRDVAVAENGVEVSVQPRILKNIWLKLCESVLGALAIQSFAGFENC